MIPKDYLIPTAEVSGGVDAWYRCHGRRGADDESEEKTRRDHSKVETNQGEKKKIRSEGKGSFFTP